MYCEQNFKTKKQLREAIANGVQVGVFQPNDMFGKTEKIQVGKHRVCVEGPHYPAPHTWYAGVELVDGVVVKVK